MKTKLLAFLFPPLLLSATPAAFDSYWNQGKAEITHYKLEQARYGELHSGHAVLIFVTEPFSRSQQVKLDDWKDTDNRIDVLKLNYTKSFLTGIYPYSMMSSTFTPIDTKANPHTLKTTTSVQDWCGHAWLQLNLLHHRPAFHAQQFSYFQTESDHAENIDLATLEDELWTRLRLSPDLLPTGNFKLIPGGFITRLLHLSLTHTPASARFYDLPAEKYKTPARAYELSTPALGNRTLTLHFASAFPHEILGWEETYLDGGKPLTTRATFVARTLSPYWEHHFNKDLPLRKELKLP